jgi:hypothetical protein
MKINVLKIWLPVFAAFIVVGCGVQSHVEKDPTANLSSYRTYAWIGDKNGRKNDKPYKDFQETYLTDLISQQLEKNGFVKATRSKPDVLIDYDIMYENDVRKQSNPVYSRPFVRYFYNPYTGRLNTLYYPSRYMGQNTYDVPYKSGTITINIVDNESKKLVWQGWAETEVTKRRIDKDDMNKIVKSIFKKLDVAKN